MDDPQQLPVQIVRRFLPGAKIDLIQPVERRGFSDARVYRVSTEAGDYALRSWPSGSIDEDRVRELQRYLGFLSHSGLPVAVPLAARSRTWVEFEGECWQLEPWLQGTPRHASQLSPARLRNTMLAVARLHGVSTQYEPTTAGRIWFGTRTDPCPSVKSRRDIITGWTSCRLSDVLQVLATQSSPFPRLLEKVLAAFVSQAPAIDAELARLEYEPFSLHPCWRDLWRDHVLFKGDDVTGLIDPNAARTDHVASDLSRLLGSLLGDDRQRWSEALDHYEQVHPLNPQEHRLIAVLDRSGVLLSGMYWVDRWLQNSGDNRWSDPALVERLRTIVARLGNKSSSLQS